MIVDDHAMIQQGLRAMLESYKEIQICGEAANGEDAITVAQTIQPDVVLMDINMRKRMALKQRPRSSRSCLRWLLWDCP
ncbi:MAG: response regulator transcription factor [Nitrospira sp.]